MSHRFLSFSVFEHASAFHESSSFSPNRSLFLNSGRTVATASGSFQYKRVLRGKILRCRSALDDWRKIKLEIVRITEKRVSGKRDWKQFVFHVSFFRGATDPFRNIISRSRYKYRGKFCRNYARYREEESRGVESRELEETLCDRVIKSFTFGTTIKCE